MRFEMDGKTFGVHDVVVDDVYGENGNRVVVIQTTSHDASNITVRNVLGISMYEGVRIGSREHANTDNVKIEGGCIVAGAEAQDQVPFGEYPNPSPRIDSLTAIAVDEGDVTNLSVTNLGYDESDVEFANGVGKYADAEAPCSSELARSGPTQP